MIITVTDNTLLNGNNPDYNYLSWVNKTSTCVYLNKLENIFRVTLSEDETNKCIIFLNGNVANIINHRFVLSEKDVNILNAYADIWCGSSIYVQQFILDIENGTFWRYFSIKYIGNKRIKSQEGYKTVKNLITDFDYDRFISATGIIEDMHAYENAFRHYFLLLYVIWIMEMSNIPIPDLKNSRFYQKFFPALFNNLNSSVIAGMEVFAEFELEYPYAVLFDEIMQLEPEWQRNFTFSITPNNMSIVFSIKEYSTIAKKFAKYLHNAWTEDDIGRIITHNASEKKFYRIKRKDVLEVQYDKELDRTTFSELRIIQGSDINRVRIILRLSGQRIINRIFSINGNVKKNIKAHELQNYIYMSDNLVAFVLWIVLNSTEESSNNFRDINKSELFPYIKFVNEYVMQRQQEIKERGSNGTLAYIGINQDIIDSNLHAFAL